MPRGARPGQVFLAALPDSNGETVPVECPGDASEGSVLHVPDPRYAALWRSNAQEAHASAGADAPINPSTGRPYTEAELRYMREQEEYYQQEHKAAKAKSKSSNSCALM